MDRIARVLVRGEGVAAACCAHLLRRSGLAVRIEGGARARVPAIVLSHTALALIRDVFGRPELLADRPPIDRRVVAWGPSAEPVAVPHAAIMTSEDDLLAALRTDDEPGFDGPPDFVIQAGAADTLGQMRFGSRNAIAAKVRMKAAADLSACWIEALDEGWLFVAPNPEGASWLLAVGAPPEQLLAKSRLIAERVDLAEARSNAFDVCPRMATAPSGEDWLSCGVSAVAFDPICGDGVAQAARGAVLAAAVIVAIAEGAEAPPLLRHYDSMLAAAMRRHLKLCADYYGAMAPRPWWSAELGALVQGFHACTSKLAAAPEPLFALRGFRLEPREAAA
ncbi:MAG: hypothetical protein ACXWKM_08150 [Phenylobacterium sp.]